MRSHSDIIHPTIRANSWTTTFHAVRKNFSPVGPPPFSRGLAPLPENIEVKSHSSWKQWATLSLRIYKKEVCIHCPWMMANKNRWWNPALLRICIYAWAVLHLPLSVQKNLCISLFQGAHHVSQTSLECSKGTQRGNKKGWQKHFSLKKRKKEKKHSCQGLASGQERSYQHGRKVHGKSQSSQKEHVWAYSHTETWAEKKRPAWQHKPSKMEWCCFIEYDSKVLSSDR